MYFSIKFLSAAKGVPSIKPGSLSITSSVSDSSHCKLGAICEYTM